MLLAWIMSVTGRAEEGIRETRLGVEFDPQSALANFVHGGALALRRRYDEAIVFERKAVDLRPDWAEALAILRDLPTQSGSPGYWRAVAFVLAGAGDREGTISDRMSPMRFGILFAPTPASHRYLSEPV